MKQIHAHALLFAIISILSGCTLPAMPETGDTCPPDGSNGIFSYIYDKSCTSDKETCILGEQEIKVSEYFNMHACPEQYPKCFQSYYNSKEYYCTQMCPDGQTLCTMKDSDRKFCLDPSNPMTCGANCNNYQKKRCKDNEGCLEIDDDFQCVPLCDGEQCECPTTQCDVNHDGTQCINNNEMCGKDCINCLDNDSICSEGGVCVRAQCQNGEHAFFLPDNTIECRQNSVEACAPQNNTSNEAIVNCNNQIAENAETMTCSQFGTCLPQTCKPGFHLNTNKTTCIEDTETACTVSGEIKNCTRIEHQSQVSCISGKCVIKSCETGYHPNQDQSACIETTPTACATVNNPAEKDCMVNASAADCVNGQCVVTKCKPDFHISETNDACIANTNAKCGQTTSNTTTSCQSPLVCVQGKCQCKNASEVLNYDKNACVIDVCIGIPGVKSGELLTQSWYNKTVEEYACNPTECLDGYEMFSQYDANSKPTKYHACLPSKKYGCKTLGYASSTILYDNEYCYAKSSTTNCAANYRRYIQACLHKDVCCGKRGDSGDDALNFVCTNCKSQGMVCDLSKGKCVRQ